MRLGISYQFPHRSCEEWGKLHREAGLGAVVFPLDWTSPVGEIDKYAEAARENDLVIAEVGAWCNPMDPDPVKRKENRLKCLRQLELAEYIGAKGGIKALTHALAVSLSGRVRVNSISPGWIDTDYTQYEGPGATQQPAGRVGNPNDISSLVLFLASDKASFIDGENIAVDGGMTKLMIYHNDHGWMLEN